MKLTIGSKAPEWWVLNEKSSYKTITEWWDGLEWQNYESPKDNLFDVCNRADLIKGLICETDQTFHLVSQNLGLDYMYKIINHNVDKIIGGFIKEYHNMVEVVSCFPC